MRCELMYASHLASLTLRLARNLAAVLALQEQYDEAILTYRETLVTQTSALGYEHPGPATALSAQPSQLSLALNHLSMSLQTLCNLPSTSASCWQSRGN
jgi:hypothetical protein